MDKEQQDKIIEKFEEWRFSEHGITGFVKGKSVENFLQWLDDEGLLNN